MDRRRPQVAGIPGTLWILKNAVITRGGDINGAKKWVPVYSLPAGTFGMYALKGQLFVFGSGTTPGGMPAGVQYQQLAAPSSPNMTRVLDVKAFQGQLYVVAQYDNGNVYHFLNGSRVTGWDSLSDANSSFAAVAEALAIQIEAGGAVRARVAGATIQITAKVPGTAFTISTSTTDVNANSTTPTATRTQLQANVAEVAEVRATGAVQITSGSFSPSFNFVGQVTVNGVPLLAVNVPWNSSNEATANALANEINNNTSTSGYSASVVGALVTITAAPGTGTTPNGFDVLSVVNGDVTTIDTDMSGGVAHVAPVAQVEKVVIAGGSFDAQDLWSITINGTVFKTTGRAAGAGTALLVLKKRLWAVAISLLRYSVLKTASDWTTTTTPSTDSGFINLSDDSEGAQRLIGVAKYQGQAAIFSRQNITIYALQTDATANAFVDSLESSGTVAPRCIVPYGNTDVFYLSDTGIRSIRGRQVTDAAYVSDVGSAIDPFVQETMAETDADRLSRAVAIIDPVDGRYMLAIGDRIFVLSFFPSSKITAWSYLEPGFVVKDFAKAGTELYARSGDTIYLYGGFDGNTYPDEGEAETFVETPFMAANDPAGTKDIEGFDGALSGDWTGEVLVDPNDPAKVLSVAAGTLNKTTYHLPAIKIPGRTSHVAFRMRSSSAGLRSLSSLALHYDTEDAQ